MSEPFMGEIRIYAFNFPPQDWAYCRGQLVSAGQNPALFAVLGQTYGGSGTGSGTTFNLPNLQGYVVAGVDPGNPNYGLGRVTGAETASLNASQFASHDHTLQAIAPPIGAQLTAAPSAATLPVGVVQSVAPNTAVKVFTTDGTAAPSPFAPGAVSDSGAEFPAPHENRQPYLTLNFCIALMGIYPYMN